MFTIKTARTCVRCKGNSYYYKARAEDPDPTEYIGAKPPKTYVINTVFNVLTNCTHPCNECVSPTQCITCAPWCYPLHDD